MCTLTHLAVGGAVGGCVGNGGLAFLAGVVSHGLLDAVPHYDIKDYRVDVALAAAGFAGVLGLGYWGTPVFWGALGAVVPDIEILLWRLGLLRETQFVFPSHTRAVGHGRQLSGRGIISQALLLLGAVGCLIVMRS